MRLRVLIPAVVIAGLSAWGSISAIDEWRFAAGAGQIAATLTQAAYGVFGILVGWAALWRPRVLGALLWLWALSVIATAALAPVVWGETAWITGLWSALAAAVLVAVFAWWLVAAVAPSLWEEAPRRELLERLSHLTAEVRPQWGKMTAPQMLTHVNDQFRMALGDLPTVPERLPIRYSHSTTSSRTCFRGPRVRRPPRSCSRASINRRGRSKWLRSPRCSRGSRTFRGTRRGLYIRRSAGCRAAGGPCSGTATPIIISVSSERKRRRL